MNDREKIESLELKIKLLETQLELERLINAQPERIVYPPYPYIEPYPYYPYYPYPEVTWADGTSNIDCGIPNTTVVTYNF